MDRYPVLEVVIGPGFLRTPPGPIHVTSSCTPGLIGMAEFSVMSQNNMTDSSVYSDPGGWRLSSTESMSTV